MPEAKSTKNRLHLGIAADDVEVATGRVQSLGGERLPSEDFSEYGFHWRVMVDPEGNELCLIYSVH